jgi:hypothetical protein
MAIGAALQSEIAALNAAFSAASPIPQAPRASITALQINAATFVSQVDSALAGAAGALDTFAAPTAPEAMAAGVVGLLTASQNQTDLANLRGLAGRVASNLDQL